MTPRTTMMNRYVREAMIGFVLGMAWVSVFWIGYGNDNDNTTGIWLLYAIVGAFFAVVFCGIEALFAQIEKRAVQARR